jgi:ribulose-bisphosphate carboxylase large chain
MSWLKVTYQVESPAAEIEARAHALAVEQSVEMPVQAIRHRRVVEEVVGRVDAIASLADGRYRVDIRLATATTGFEIGQLLNMLYGNASILDHVQLLDAELPNALLSAFAGPRFGIAGIRAALDVQGRPLSATALKPQGCTPQELAELCHTFALAGIDIIKDDHGLADQDYAPFAARVALCQRAVERACRETGRRVLYAPNLSGGPRRLAEQLRVVREEGVGMVMVAPMLLGLPTTQEIIAGLELPVLGHPALAGAARIAPPLLLGKLFRLVGVDATIFPNFGGRFAYSRETCRELADAARGPLGDLAPILPVPAGGMTLERVPEMLDYYGSDVMLLIGGALLSAGDALLERSREFVEIVSNSKT